MKDNKFNNEKICLRIDYINNNKSSKPTKFIPVFASIIVDDELDKELQELMSKEYYFVE